MILKTKYLSLVLILVFFTVVFWVSVVPLRDPDIWFHLKSGELIAQKGIFYYDVFSHSGQGRFWYPYEWLFQLLAYWVQEIFGFEALRFLVPIAVTTQVGLLLILFRKIFKLNLWLSLGACFFFIASTYEFFTARPHIIAYTFLIFILVIILDFYFKAKLPKFLSLKNLFWFTLPFTIIWANLHGSIFLNIFLFGSYSFIALVNFFLFRNPVWLQKFKTLVFFTILTSLVSILPPLGFLQYQLLWQFFLEREKISQFISEWVPLSVDPLIYFVSVLYIGVLLLFLSVTLLKKQSLKVLWVLPLLSFLVLAYLATRNVFLGFLTTTILLGWSLAQFKVSALPKILQLIFYGTIVAGLAGCLWLIYEKLALERLYYPVNAVNFLKNNHLKGHMFNEYGYGGYILYNLYPEYRVFYDGRTDVYLCCELPDTLNLSYKKQLNDQEYKPYLNQLFSKYDISFVILSSRKHSVMRKIARILSDDPGWILIFWDDYTHIFVKRDGKNDAIINKFAAIAATPYNQNPFREGKENEALAEYQNMIKMVDSSKSRNAIGFILLRKGRFAEASAQFQKAVALDQSNESPLMNMAELAAKDKNYTQAIELYEKALPLAPDRGLIYIRLGQLYLQNGEELSKAKDIWQKGVENTVDEDARKKLLKLLSK